MLLKDLIKPFQPREHKFNYQNWAYIDEDAISTRLDNVCGIENWQLKQTDLRQVTATHWVATVELSILTDNGWVTRSGTGEGTTSINKPYKNKDPLEDPRYVTNMGENAAKGAATDAFRRAARIWGIGRYLLNLPKTDEGGPIIQDKEALGKWLIANYAKYDDNDPDDPGAGKNTSDNGQQPDNNRTNAGNDNADQFVGRPLSCRELKRTTGPTNAKEHRWSGKVWVDDADMTTWVTFFKEQLELVDSALGYAPGSIQARIPNITDEPIKFSADLTVYATKTKSGELKVDHIPVEFKDNPAVFMAFKLKYPKVTISQMKVALATNDPMRSSHSMATARIAMDKYLEQQAEARTEQARIADELVRQDDPDNITDFNAYTGQPNQPLAKAHDR